MQQHTQPTLRKVVQKNSHNANSLSVQMIDLRVVQQAVANLMNRIDEITDKGGMRIVAWHVCLFYKFKIHYV